jgi:hypothetical protein
MIGRTLAAKVTSGDISFDHDGQGGDGAVPFAVVDARLKITHKDFEMIA